MIAGVDISTRALTLCALPGDSESTLSPAWREEPIEAALDRNAMLCRNASRAAVELFVGLDLVSVAIEMPAGYGDRKLLPILGAVTARVPSGVPVAWFRASEWRKVLGVPQKKKDAHRLMLDSQHGEWLADRSEHDLDAAGLALAWRILQWRAAA